MTLARLASLRRDVDELKRGLGRMTVSASAVQFVGAADLVLGTRADFGRACSRTGTVLETIRQAPEELYEAFLARAEIAANWRNAWRLVIGGIDPDFNPDFDPGSSQPSVPPPKGAIVLPDGEGLHLGERRALKLILASKRTVLRAGRRWGKSSLLVAIAIDEALRGRPVGVFSPFYKTAVPVFDALAYALAPLIVSRHRGQGELVLVTGSHIDVWTLEASTIVARGRKYACALVDEAAHVKANMAIIWKASISPTLIDIADSYAVAASTPWGTDPANFFFQICNDKSLGWVEMHARSEDNPYLPRESLEEEKRVNSPLVWRQEYEAEFTSLELGGADRRDQAPAAGREPVAGARAVRLPVRDRRQRHQDRRRRRRHSRRVLRHRRTDSLGHEALFPRLRRRAGDGRRAGADGSTPSSQEPES